MLTFISAFICLIAALVFSAGIYALAFNNRLFGLLAVLFSAFVFIESFCLLADLPYLFFD